MTLVAAAAPGDLMTDTITESFCERCGTRYSLAPTARRRRGGFGRVRVLTRGLKNYVANDGMPMDEAMAAAQSDEARAGISRQLEAFHQTFNFCISCRQYTCANCWNEKAVECLSCAPDLSREVLPAPFPDMPLHGPEESDDAARDGEVVADAAWPTVDLARATGAAATIPERAAPVEEPEVLARLEAFVAAPAAGGADELTATELAEIESALAAVHPAAEPVAAEMVAEPVAVEPAVEPAAVEMVAEPAPEPVAAEAPAEPAPEPVAFEMVAATSEGAVERPVDALDDRVTTARGQTRSLLGRFRPARRAGAAVAADAAVAGAAAPARRMPAPAEPAVEPTAEEGPARIADVAAESPPESAHEPAPVPADTIEQPTWQVVAPDAAPVPRPDWPDAPAWPSPDPKATPTPSHLQGPSAAPWASRLATARPESGGIWAASSQEVLAAPGPVAAGGPGPAVQACVSCGLSLSANARFCRRCGSRQA